MLIQRLVLAVFIALSTSLPLCAQDKTFAEMADSLKKAALQGNTNAQSGLGFFYYLGLGVPQDYKQALFWYRKAALQEDAGGQSGLGKMYYYGAGVPQDYKQAAFWYRKAALQGDAGAQAELGEYV